MAAPAMVRDSGEVWLGLQVRHSFGDPSRDLGAVLEKALATDEPGIVGLVDPPGPGARLQDLVADEPLEVTVHDGLRAGGSTTWPSRTTRWPRPSSRPTARSRRRHG